LRRYTKDAGGAVAVLGGGSVTDTGVNPRVDFSGASMTGNLAARGRGLHSSTSHLDLRRF